jgi:hypothetical protein
MSAVTIRAAASGKGDIIKQQLAESRNVGGDHSCCGFESDRVFHLVTIEVAMSAVTIRAAACLMIVASVSLVAVAMSAVTIRAAAVGELLKGQCAEVLPRVAMSAVTIRAAAPFCPANASSYSTSQCRR